jgi:hypothetical protein
MGHICLRWGLGGLGCFPKSDIGKRLHKRTLAIVAALGAMIAFVRSGDAAMKDNYAVIWTEQIEIEELEPKLAPSGSATLDD